MISRKLVESLSLANVRSVGHSNSRAATAACQVKACCVKWDTKMDWPERACGSAKKGERWWRNSNSESNPKARTWDEES